MMKIFETKFAGLTLPNPIMVASSGLTGTADKNKELEKAGAGALVLKSLFEEQMSKKSASLLLNNDYPEEGESVLNYFKTNEVNNYLNLIQDSKNRCTIPIVASINCHKDDSWMDFAHQIERAGADAIELNILALNTDIFLTQDSLEETYIRITQKVKEVVNIPVIIKMGKYFSHIVSLVNCLHQAGADGVVLFNRFYQPDIDIVKLQMTSGNVFSSSADISDTLRWAGIITGRLPETSVAACTGVHDWEDIVKCILSGVSAVQICSTLYQNGNEIIEAIKRGMEEWMLGMNFHSIDAFKGKLNYTQVEDPSLYERAQFMKYFSNRD